MNKLFPTILISLFFSFSFAQNDWVNDMFDPNANFFQTQEKFNSYWENKEIEKGKGWKQFKRWEAFMEPRVNSNGKFNHQNLFKEWVRNKNVLKSTPQIQANWTAYGPTNVPLQSNGSKRGIGRLNVVEFDPNDSNILWVGSPAGGLWKSVDGGQNWSSNTDLLPNLGVSDIAIDPTNSNIMFIATGDRDGGDTYSYGIMKSIDGGTSWDSTGLSFYFTQTYRGNRILINPNNTNEILVSTRRASGTGEVYRSIDGGNNFSLQLQENLISMEFKPNDPNVVYGGTQVGGPSKIFKSNDNGQNWTQLSSNLPTSGVGRCQVAVTPANPDVVYAVFCGNDNGFYGLYKSLDQGITWNVQSDSSNAPNLLDWSTDGSGSGGQGWYDLSLTVSPYDENTIFVGGINTWKSVDGGITWNICSHWYGGGGVEYKHADEHYLKYNPSTARLYSANDGGLYYSDNDGNNWTDISDGLQISQFYRSGISQTNPALIISGAQDNGTLLMNGINLWDAVRGGDGMECIIDPTNENIMYSSVYYGAISKSTNGGGSFNDISPANDGAWVTPYVLDPSNPNRIIAGYTEVWESTDGGASWNTLTNGQAGGTIDAIAVSKSNGNVIYFSEYNDIYVTDDNGATWTDITNGLPNRSISYIAIDPNNSDKAWITYSGFGNGQKVYKTTDRGNSWSNISAGIPNIPANCVIINHLNSGLEELYIGTDLGVYYKDTSMTLFQTFNNGLPNVIVNELEIQYQNNQLIATTYGRGIWKTDLPITLPPSANFIASDTLLCDVPAQVNFQNNSTNALSFIWDFGDGNTSTDFNPSHTYTSFGDFTINLIATGPLGSDTIIKSQHISILPSNPCIYSMPLNSYETINACSGTLFDSGGENGDYSNNEDSYVTIAPFGADQISISFSDFGIEAPSSATSCNFDYLEIFDGLDTNAQSLGQFCNSLTGSPGTIVSSTGAITIHLHSDGGVTDLGFQAIWNCVYPNQAPLADATIGYFSECTGVVQFVDQSIYNPTSWYWDFGDGNFSNLQHPSHTYTQNGIYDVQLIVSNAFGNDTVNYSSLININIAPLPITINDSICYGEQANLYATGLTNNLYWFTNPSGGSSINVGNFYNTGPLTNTTTYYVEELVSTSSIFGGPIDNNTLGAGGYHDNDAWDMVFNCSEVTILKSVEVYAQTNFTTTIELLDNNANVVDDTIVSINTGLNTINLNFLIGPGLGYRLGINGTNDGLWRNNAVPTGIFPIVVGNNIEITGNTTSSPQAYFYYFYNWEVEEFCSSDRSSITAWVYPQNQVTIQPDSNINLCYGDSILLTASPGFNSYSWNTGETNQNIWANSSTNYSINAADLNGCTSQDNVYVSIAPENINVNLISPACIGDTAYIQADNGYVSYNWSTGDLTRTISIYQDGNYSVQAIDNNGCILDGNISVVFNTPISANISLTPSGSIICEQDIFTLCLQTGMNSYVWSNGGNTSCIDISESTAGNYVYWGEITDQNGCVNLDSITVIIDSCLTSIEGFTKEPINLYPNPSSGNFVISHKSNNNEIFEIKILDIQGKQISNRKCNYNNQFLLEEFNFDNINKGLYMINIKTKNGLVSKKIIIQ